MFTKEMIIRSPLSPEEALEHLKAATIYTRLNPYDPKKALFRGTVGSSSFRISPLLNYSGAFFPRIKGTITPVENGSVLWATAHPLIYAKVFYLIWSGVLSFFLLLTTIAAITGKVPFYLPLIFLGMLGVGALMLYPGYVIPERKAEERLRKLLETETNT